MINALASILGQSVFVYLTSMWYIWPWTLSVPLSSQFSTWKAVCISEIYIIYLFIHGLSYQSFWCVILLSIFHQSCQILTCPQGWSKYKVKAIQWYHTPICFKSYLLYFICISFKAVNAKKIEKQFVIWLT